MTTITPQRQALEQQASSLIWGLVRANNAGILSDTDFDRAYAEVEKMLQGQDYDLTCVQINGNVL